MTLLRRFANLLIFPALVARRSLLAMRIVRSLYHGPFPPIVRRGLTFLFDPASIRRNTEASIPSRRVRIVGKLGDELQVNLGDHIGWNFFLHGFFDLVPALVAITLHRQSPGSVYLDVGANVGDTSIAVARRGVNTVGIDASAMAIADLCHNIALNSPIPYTVVHAAVCATTARRSGNLEDDYSRLTIPMGNSGAASIHDRWNRSTPRDVAVLASRRSVSDIVEGLSIRSICCIKLDVEGAEAEALRGMHRILQRFQCPVLFEYRRDQMTAVGMQPEAVLRLLPRGYRCVVIRCEQIEAESAVLRIGDFDDQQSYENVFAYHGELPAALRGAQRTEGCSVRFDEDPTEPVSRAA